MPEYAVGGPIPLGSPMPQLDNSYAIPASPSRQFGDVYDPELPPCTFGVIVDETVLKRLNDLQAAPAPDATVVEKHIVDSIADVVAQFSEAIPGADFPVLLETLQPIVRPLAEAISASMTADETLDELTARLAALKIKEP